MGWGLIPGLVPYDCRGHTQSGRPGGGGLYEYGAQVKVKFRHSSFGAGT